MMFGLELPDGTGKEFTTSERFSGVNTNCNVIITAAAAFAAAYAAAALSVTICS